MISIERDPALSRATSDDAHASRSPAVAARPVMRRAAAAPATAARATGAVAMSDGLRRAIRAFASRGEGAESAPRDANVGGLFGQAINTGIHEVESAARDPLGALGGMAGNALGGAGGALATLAQNPLGALGGIGDLARNPLGALQGVLGGAGGIAGALGGIGDLARNPLGALQGMLGGAGSALGGIGGALGGIGDLARNPLGALQGALGSAGGAGGALAGIGDLARNPLGALGGLATSALGAATGNSAGTATDAGAPGAASAADGASADAPPPQLAPLRASLSPDLQGELDRLAATPDGLAAINAELRGTTASAVPAAAVPAPAAAGPVARHGNGEIHDTAGTALDRAASASASSLPGDLRQRFEASLGADLSGVRVHTDDTAAAAATAFGAHAFAHGQDVYFAAGQYAPGTPAGDHLIAHEVAHTVQQRGATAVPQYQLEVSEPGDPLELEADRAADAMVAGTSLS